VIANRSDATDQIDKFNAVVGLKTMAHFPHLDEIRRSRLTKSTLFELEPTPAVVAVQNEYMRLAAALWYGVGPLAGCAHEGPRHFLIYWGSTDATQQLPRTPGSDRGLL